MVNRHVPRRRCIGCGQVFEKMELIRLVKDAEGIRVDLAQRAAGRGFYLCPQATCLARAVKRKHSLLSGQGLEDLGALLATELSRSVGADVAALGRTGRLGAAEAQVILNEVAGGAGHDLAAATAGAVADDFPLERCFKRDVRLLSRLSSKGL